MACVTRQRDVVYVNRDGPVQIVALVYPGAIRHLICCGKNSLYLIIYPLTFDALKKARIEEKEPWTKSTVSRST